MTDTQNNHTMEKQNKINIQSKSMLHFSKEEHRIKASFNFTIS